MKKIRLLFILPSLNGGGAERVTCNLISSLNRYKFDITLFLFNKEGVYWDILPPDIEVAFCNGKNDRFKINLFKSLYKVAKNSDIMIASMELMPTYISVIVGKILNKKIIGWVHINIDSILNDKKTYIKILHKYILVKLFYNKLNKIITVSNGSKNALKKYLKSKNQNIVDCVYNPINIDYIKEKSKEYFQENLKKPLIIGIGRLEKQKNFILLIKAHKLLLDRGIEQNLLILGEGTQKEYLINEVKKMKLDNSVSFLGFKKNPYKYLKEADVFVQSSIYEGLPTVLIEALALDVPVVATNCPDGADEILFNGKYGLLVEMNNVEKLAEGINKLLSDKELIKKYKSRAKEAVNRFDNKYIVKSFETKFLDLFSL